MIESVCLTLPLNKIHSTHDLIVIMREDETPEHSRSDADHRAERRIGGGPDRTSTLSDDSLRKQLFELQASQIKLEMQDEELSELQRAQNELQEVLARYAELYDFAPLGYITLDSFGMIRDVNLSGATLLGQERSRLHRRRLSSYLDPRSRQPFLAFLQRVFSERTTQTCIVNLPTLDQATRYIQIDAGVDPSGKSCHAVMQDITGRKLAEESMQLASLVYENSSEAMAVFDAEGDFLSINPAFTVLSGYLQADLVGLNFGMLRTEHDVPAAYDLLLRSIEANGHWEGEMWLRRKNGEARICALNVNAIFNANRTVQRYVALCSDITKRKESEDLIWRQANFDSLTGLPNRNMFLDHLEQEIRKSHRSGTPLALMFLDLDHFKDVNDTLGHASGDLLLREAARRLRKCIRDTDTVARLGGDEFTIVMGQLDDADAVERIANDILTSLGKPFCLAGTVVYVTASIGVTVYPGDAIETASLLKNADQAMYAAKNRGRNCYHYFTPGMQDAAQNRMRLTHDLRKGVTADQFQLLYQPIVDMTTGAICKAEALIRWHHPTLGMIEPSNFIPLAEATGIITDIGNWVFREARMSVAHWRKAHHEDFQVSVNMSPVEFHDTAPHIFSARREAAVGITVEITEGILLDASTEVTERLVALRDNGVQVSLDDFGTGYSSLSYLKKFAIDYIKIDRSFVCNLTSHSDDLALCEAIIVMAHKLSLKVVAEGIETEQQRMLLAEAGCDFGQGYLYSKAVTASEFEGLLRKGHFH